MANRLKNQTNMRASMVVLAAMLYLATPGISIAADRVALQTLGVEGADGASNETSLDGVVEAVRQTTLSTQVPGAIVALHVKVGDVVKAGQELLRIDARAAQLNVAGSSAQVQAAQAALNLAAQDLERQKALQQKQYISQAALERSQAQWEAAQAQVKALKAQTSVAQAQSGFYVVQAPYAGVVSDVPVASGDMAMPGRPLVAMYDPARMRVTAAVAQSRLAVLGTQLQSVRYEFPGAGARAVPAQVQLLPTIDSETHTAQIRLTLAADLQGAVPGMFARIWIPEAAMAPTGGVQRLYVPTQAIVRRAEMTGVYVVNEQGVPRLRLVRLGRVEGKRVEVLSGLHKDDRVAADPQAATVWRRGASE